MQTDYATTDGRRFSFKTIGMVSAVFLFALLIAAGTYVYKGYKESQDIRQYVVGPFSAQLLYLQTCAADNADSRGRPGALEAQLRSCHWTAIGKRAGFFVYDFNIRRSVALTETDLALWKEYSVLSFPDSVHGQVRDSETNPFNEIVIFSEFTGFDYDCVLAEGESVPSCRRATASCEHSPDSIRCSVFNPRTGKTELHVIERLTTLELLLPQGFIRGPDLFKFLKPRFFPVLDRL